MGVLSRKAGRVRREARPVAISILWKPLRDPHYVVASLQPGGGGLRQIFVRQSTLGELQALARGNPEQSSLDCSSGSDWTARSPHAIRFIESHVDVALSSIDERVIAEEIRALRGQVAASQIRRSARLVLHQSIAGCGGVANARGHTRGGFGDRWQTILTLAKAGKAGAFFLHDCSAARWFHAPFYEVTDSKAGSRAPGPRVSHGPRT